MDFVPSIEYLGFVINSNLDFNPFAIDKYKQVQKSFYSASFLLNKLSHVSHSLKSFIYKTFCLSQFTYGLENLTLDNKTIKTLNVNQNNLVRQMFNLRSNCHMSGILKTLRLFKMDQLYLFTKMSFISSIEFNPLASNIFQYICSFISNNTQVSQLSFANDLKRLMNFTNLNLDSLLNNIGQLKLDLKRHFYIRDGISDSIELCLSNLRFRKFQILLNELIKPN